MSIASISFRVFCVCLFSPLKDDVVAPKIRTFEDHFEQHLQVVSSQLCNGPPSEFLRMINRMRSPDMGDIDYHSANILMKVWSHFQVNCLDCISFFQSLANERILVKFWGIWGQEHIFSKIFMHSRSSSGGTDSPRASSGGSNLPLKEGLMGIIRALKTQEVTGMILGITVLVHSNCWFQKSLDLHPCMWYRSAAAQYAKGHSAADNLKHYPVRKGC